MFKRSQRRRSFAFSRSAVAGAVLSVGLILTGCSVPEYLLNAERAAERLQQSDEFSAVNFEYEQYDPMTRPRTIYDYSAALHDNADLEEAGRLLAEINRENTLMPEISVGDGTWLYTSDLYGPTVEFDAQDWTELLDAARTTHAQQLTVWKYDSYDAEERDDFEQKITLTARTETATEGFAAFEAFQHSEIPADMSDEHVWVQLEAGTDDAPWSYDTREVGQRWGMGDPDYHVLVEGPRESDIQQAETLYKIAERELGEVIDFRFVYSDPLQRDPKFSLDIWHAGDYEACEDNLAYAAMVHKLLEAEVEIELSHAEDWNDVPREIYDDTPRGEALAEGGDPTKECYPGL